MRLRSLQILSQVEFFGTKIHLRSISWIQHFLDDMPNSKIDCILKNLQSDDNVLRTQSIKDFADLPDHTIGNSVVIAVVTHLQDDDYDSREASVAALNHMAPFGKKIHWKTLFTILSVVQWMVVILTLRIYFQSLRTFEASIHGNQ